MARRRKKLTDDEIVTICENELVHSLGYEDDELSAERENSIKYYFAEPRGDERAGGSSVISTDLADMCEAVLAEVMPGVENDDLCAFVPQGQEDVEQAALETDAVNSMIMQNNDGYMLFNTAFMDALLFENCYNKVWVKEEIDQRTQEFVGIEPAAVAGLIQIEDPRVQVEVVSEDRNADEETLIDLTLRITITNRELKVTSSDVTNVYPSARHDSLELSGIPFIAERDFPTRTDLINEGIRRKVVYDLPAITTDTKGDSQRLQRDTKAASLDSEDKSQERIERYCCYVMLDVDATGVGELWYVEMANSVLLKKERAEFVPMATGSAFPQPHQLRGVSLYKRLKQVQDIKTKAIRNWLENQEAVNYGRFAANDNVDYEALTTPRPGGVIPCENPTMDLLAITTPDQSQSTLSLLEYSDKMRSERGGASLDLQSAEAQIAGDTAHGVERQYSAREKLAGRMARNLAQTVVKQTFLLVHQALRTYMPGDYTFKRGNEFVTVDPSQWAPRNDVNVKSGMTLAERNQELQALQAVYREQKELIMAGRDGIITDESKAYNALLDMSRAAGIDDPHRYWTDPTSEEAQQARLAKQQQQQQQEQQTQLLLQIQKQIEDDKNRVDVFEAKLDAFVDLIKELGANERKEAELTAQSVLSLITPPEGTTDDGRGTGETTAG